MKKLLIFVYGIVSYLIFFACFLYLIGFLSNWLVPKSIDSGEAGSITGPLTGPLWPAFLVNLGLMALFGLQHSIMARPGFKAWWTRIVPKAAERSTYVLLSSLLLILLYWQWRPLPTVLWQVDHWLGQAFFALLMGVGVGLILVSSFLINHFELFGLQQVYQNLRSAKPAPAHFGTPWLYQLVRHPLHLGTTTVLWATPTMTAGHLLFAVVMTIYIVIGIYYEERDLVRHFGDTYREYQQKTPMLLPSPRRAADQRKAQPATAGD
jgi:methanethiol S-methyltransferase